MVKRVIHFQWFLRVSFVFVTKRPLYSMRDWYQALEVIGGIAKPLAVFACTLIVLVLRSLYTLVGELCIPRRRGPSTSITPAEIQSHLDRVLTK